jgi:hypothetical protein
VECSETQIVEIFILWSKIVDLESKKERLVRWRLSERGDGRLTFNFTFCCPVARLIPSNIPHLADSVDTKMHTSFTTPTPRDGRDFDSKTLCGV